MEQRLKAGLSLLRADSRLEACKNLGPAQAVVTEPPFGFGTRQVVRHRDRNADLRRQARLHAIKTRRTHADDGQSAPVDMDLFAHNGPVSGKARLPVAIAEDRER